VVERLPLRVDTGKGRQQRRMDVHDRVRERLTECWTQQSHESGEADEANAALTQFRHEGAIVRLTRRMCAMRHDERLDAGFACRPESSGVGIMGDDDAHARVQSSLALRVKYRAEIRAAPRNQYGEGDVPVFHR
jgi:hypothetical protein